MKYELDIFTKFTVSGLYCTEHDSLCFSRFLFLSPRQQVTEIIFVLKAISTLMDSLKKTQPENGETGLSFNTLCI